MKEGWRLLRYQQEEQGLQIEPEVRIDENGATFLGCRHRCFPIALPDGRPATAMEYDMEEYVESSIALYRSLVQDQLGPSETPESRYLRNVRPCVTPFLTEDHRDSPAGRPAATGKCMRCPGCWHTFPPQPVFDDISELESTLGTTWIPPACVAPRSVFLRRARRGRGLRRSVREC